MLRCGSPVYVEWTDSASYAGWRPDTDGMQVGKVRSVGYVFGVNKEGIILTTSLANVPGVADVVALDSVVIPHNCIQNLQVLELAAIEAKPMLLQLEGVIVGEEIETGCLKQIQSI